MRFRNLLALIFIVGVSFAICLSGCGDKENPQQIGTSVWLTESPCSPPCWFDIVPSVTSEDEVQNILLDNPFVQKGSIIFTDVNSQIFPNKYLFSLYDGVQGEIYIRENKASYLTFSGKLGVYLKDILLIVGDPEVVLLTKAICSGHLFTEDSCVEAKVFYPSVGVMVQINSETSFPSFELTENAVINSLLLFKPEDFAILVDHKVFYYQNGEVIRELLQRWVGYGNYQYINE